MAAGETIALTNAANVQLLCVIKRTGLAPVDVSQDIKTLDFAKRVCLIPAYFLISTLF